MGIECMFIQGLRRDACKGANLSNADMMDFASNAFNGFVILAVCIGMVKDCLLVYMTSDMGEDDDVFFWGGEGATPSNATASSFALSGDESHSSAESECALISDDEATVPR